MSLPTRFTAACDCHDCTVANTPKLVYPGVGRFRGREMHGAQAARQIREDAAASGRIKAVADRLRSGGFKAQSGDEPR